ncbi:hypothetical protein MNBD_GAMMA26-1432 [hydrothermal vent metagenome]|uniref:PqqD family protein n=1 Tax=hydrothermal vent metagenome TaxID=652676 RepID=A0A3B1AMH9_9ZZZZ
MSDKYQTQENLVVREIVGETLIVPISGKLANMEQLFSLNPVGASIWKLLDGKLTLAEICTDLLDNFDVQPDTAYEDLNQLVLDLLKADLIIKTS